MGYDKRTGHYSLREILGYPAKYYAVLSERGPGKSWAAKHFLIRQPGSFMCLYRQQPDMELAVKDWVDPLVQGDAQHQPMNRERFRIEGNGKNGFELFLDGEFKGCFRYLTQVNHIKQEVFPDDMNWVWLDEFIPLVYKKLPGMASEGDAIRTIVKTIEHDTVRSREERGLRPVRVLMFANPFTWDNPILSYFHIDGLRGPGIHRAGPGVVWELLAPIEGKKDSVDEFLGDEVNRNMGFLKQDAFVGPLPKGARIFMSLRLGRSLYTVYATSDGMKYWVMPASGHKDARSPYSGRVQRWGTLEGLQEDEDCFEDSRHPERFRRLLKRGAIWFTDINAKFDFMRDLADAKD